MGMILDFASAGLGLIAAVLWLVVSFVRIPTGFDMDEEQDRAFKKAGWLNAAAAFFTALSVAAPALKYFLGQ